MKKTKEIDRTKLCPSCRKGEHIYPYKIGGKEISNCTGDYMGKDNRVWLCRCEICKKNG